MASPLITALAGAGSLAGQVLDAPRKFTWNMLGLPDTGEELLSDRFGFAHDSPWAKALGMGVEMLGDPLMLLGGVGGKLLANRGSRLAAEEAAQFARPGANWKGLVEPATSIAEEVMPASRFPGIDASIYRNQNTFWRELNYSGRDPLKMRNPELLTEGARPSAYEYPLRHVEGDPIFGDRRIYADWLEEAGRATEAERERRMALAEDYYWRGQRAVGDPIPYPNLLDRKETVARQSQTMFDAIMQNAAELERRRSVDPSGESLDMVEKAYRKAKRDYLS